MSSFRLPRASESGSESDSSDGRPTSRRWGRRRSSNVNLPSTPNASSSSLSLPFPNTRKAVGSFIRRASRSNSRNNSVSDFSESDQDTPKLSGPATPKTKRARQRRAGSRNNGGGSFTELNVYEREDGKVRVGIMEDERVRARAAREDAAAGVYRGASWRQNHWQYLIDPVAWGYFVAI